MLSSLVYKNRPTYTYISDTRAIRTPSSGVPVFIGPPPSEIDKFDAGQKRYQERCTLRMLYDSKKKQQRRR